MTDDHLLDNGPAQVLVLRDGDAGLEADRIAFPGGSADVFLDDGQALVQVAAGSPDSVELLRATLSSPAFRARGEVLDVVVVSGGGWDRYVLSADLEHRWLFTRHWDRRRDDAATAALVGHSPFRRETSSGATGTRRALATALELLRDAVGVPATLHVTNVFTRRTDENSEITGAPGDRRRDPGVVADALGDSHAVLAAWGTVPAGGLDAVDDTVAVLRRCRDGGARILVRSHGGEVETSGDPPQPSAHRVVRQGTRLVDAPNEWLWGGRLDG